MTEGCAQSLWVEVQWMREHRKRICKLALGSSPLPEYQDFKVETAHLISFVRSTERLLPPDLFTRVTGAPELANLRQLSLVDSLKFPLNLAYRSQSGIMEERSSLKGSNYGGVALGAIKCKYSLK